MKFWLGVTDNQWFSYLATADLDEVNFWQPSPKRPFVKAPVGMPFLFKLKKPNHHVAGGGFFVAYSTLPLSLAWEVFGEKNGAPSLRSFQELIGIHDLTSEIGCTVLANTFFLSRDQWLDHPPGFFTNIVRGKMYQTSEPAGAVIWQAMESHFHDVANWRSVGAIGDRAPRYGEPTLFQPRLGQGSFRVMVTDAYKRRCALTGENTLVALEAAHILPYANQGKHEVSNGLLLRADFHRLFDVGLVTVTPEFKIRVSPKIREAWFNGKVYYALNDRPVAVLPDDRAHWPDRDLLQWHGQNCFQS